MSFSRRQLYLYAPGLALLGALLSLAPRLADADENSLIFQGAHQPVFEFSQGALYFKDMAPNQIRVERVVLRNTGGPARFTLIEPKAPFSIEHHTCEGFLDHGQSCQIDILFAPINAGVINDSVRVLRNSLFVSRVLLEGDVR